MNVRGLNDPVKRDVLREFVNLSMPLGDQAGCGRCFHRYAVLRAGFR
jgi:hypothetical protein